MHIQRNGLGGAGYQYSEEAVQQAIENVRNVNKRRS